MLPAGSFFCEWGDFISDIIYNLWHISGCILITPRLGRCKACSWKVHKDYHRDDMPHNFICCQSPSAIRPPNAMVPGPRRNICINMAPTVSRRYSEATEGFFRERKETFPPSSSKDADRVKEFLKSVSAVLQTQTWEPPYWTFQYNTDDRIQWRSPLLVHTSIPAPFPVRMPSPAPNTLLTSSWHPSGVGSAPKGSCARTCFICHKHAVP